MYVGEKSMHKRGRSIRWVHQKYKKLLKHQVIQNTKQTTKYKNRLKENEVAESRC